MKKCCVSSVIQCSVLQTYQLVIRKCSPLGGTACNDATAKDYACKLLHLADAKTIALWQQHVSKQHDHAYAYDTIKDACHGVASARSQYVQLRVNCFTNYCYFLLNPFITEFISQLSKILIPASPYFAEGRHSSIGFLMKVRAVSCRHY